MKKGICVFVVGDKYRRLFENNKVQLYEYAKKCSAELIILDRPLDNTFHRTLLAQKLLIPKFCTDFDIVLFLDLDILISEFAPDVFDYLPEDKSFGAVLDPRGKEEFIKTWQHIPRILEETTEKYFTDRNFEAKSNLRGSINGGVFIFRPKKIANFFECYYYSNHNQGELNSFEETPFAYFSQVNNWFAPLPASFNVQVLYKLKGTLEGINVTKSENRIPRCIRKWYYKKTNYCFYPTSVYRKFVQELIKNNFFVHFAGNYPIIKDK
jgi:hypothetical protein